MDTSAQTFAEYQEKSRLTAKYPNLGKDLVYPILGLVGESGEVAEKYKRVIRDDGQELTVERREEIIQELGDVLWYLSQVATELRVDLQEVAESNLRKLFSRLEREKIHGSGDSR